MRAPFAVGLTVAAVMLAGFGQGARAQNAAYTCTEIIGFSQTMQWFYGAPGYESFESLAGPGRWQLRWEGGAGVTEWANPNFYGWGSGYLRGNCAQGSAQPDRVLYNISGDFSNDANWWAQQIRAVITNIRDKYPNQRQIILQAVVGGPGGSLCSVGGQTVRASYNNPYIEQAIRQLMGGEVVAGIDPAVRTCNDYGDWVGHLAENFIGPMGVTIGQYYASSSNTATPTPTNTPGTGTSTPTPTPTPGQGCTSGCAVTVTFDELPPDRALDGQYPTGIIDWGAGGWYVSAPWGRFDTNSVSFASTTDSSATFTYVGDPRRLIQLDAYNGGSESSSVTLSCDGSPSTQVTVPPDEIRSVPMGWVGTCRSVGISSSNGWQTNFDNLIVDNGAQTESQAPAQSGICPAHGGGTAAPALATPGRARAPAAPRWSSPGRPRGSLNPCAVLP